MSCYMLLSSFFTAPFPIHACDLLPRFQSTWHRLQCLDDLVDLNSDTLLQYHTMAVRTYFPSVSPPPLFGGGEDSLSDTPSAGDQRNSSGGLVSSGENNIPVVSSGENVSPGEQQFYFDAVSSPLPLAIFHDTVPPSYYDQLLDFSAISLPEITVQCDHHTSYDVTLDVRPCSGASLSPRGLVTASIAPVDLLYPSTSSFPIIFDSGASLAITFDRSDFVGPIRPLSSHLGGLASGLAIKGIGTVYWKFRTEKSVLTVVASAYYVPDAKQRLISPQRLFNSKQDVSRSFIVKETNSVLVFDGVGKLITEYDSGNNLPTALAKNKVPGKAEVNLAGVLSEENLNLSPAQKLLLHWHNRFGHKSMTRVQALLRAVPFLSAKFQAASRCEVPLCEICQYAKAHRQPTKGSIQIK